MDKITGSCEEVIMLHCWHSRNCLKEISDILFVVAVFVHIKYTLIIHLILKNHLYVFQME